MGSGGKKKGRTSAAQKRGNQKQGDRGDRNASRRSEKTNGAEKIEEQSKGNKGDQTSAANNAPSPNFLTRGKEFIGRHKGTAGAIAAALTLGAACIGAYYTKLQADIGQRAEQRDVQRHRGKMVFDDIEVLIGPPRVSTARMIQFAFKNIGEGVAKQTAFSMHHILVDGYGNESVLDTDCEAYGGTEDVAPGKVAKYGISEPGMPEGGPYEEVIQREVREGISRLRVRARVDYKYITDDGREYPDSAPVCRELVWKARSWVVCDERPYAATHR